MSRRFNIGSAFLLVVILSSLNSIPVLGQDVEITVNPDVDLSAFHSYSWNENMIAPAQLPEERKKTEGWIVDAVDRELQKKGYVEDSRDSDFSIEIRAMGIYGDTVTSANIDHRMPSGGFIYDSQRPLGPGVDIWMTLIAGARIIVTDEATGAVAWEAVLTKKYKDPDKLTNNLKKEIDKIFKKGMKKFPSSKNKK